MFFKIFHTKYLKIILGALHLYPPLFNECKPSVYFALKLNTEGAIPF